MVQWATANNNLIKLLIQYRLYVEVLCDTYWRSLAASIDSEGFVNTMQESPC